MSHILVKWEDTEAWDVYPTRAMIDVATASAIMKDPTLVDTFIGKCFETRWKADAEPAKAYLIQAGDAAKLERKRNRLATRATSHSSQSHHAQQRCCTHSEQVQALEKENNELKRRLEQQENLIESGKMVRRLKYMLREVQEQHVQNISQTGQCFSTKLQVHTQSVSLRTVQCS
ncbi:uncharacterized protein LOC135387013 [Ornithodoros turicata]|uniref:uncharacterized protein LOC135387013 n=1 Tax=Ornithodoros turicata TaxID=34597 RepID=UPI003138E50B